MLKDKVLHGAILILCFSVWDISLKESFYNLIAPNGDVGMAEIAVGYGIVFITALILSQILIKTVKPTSTDDES